VNNCVNCAVATDATFAGFPATALPSDVALPVSILEDLFGTGFRRVAGRAAVETEMSALGAGARGIVFVRRSGDTVGHVFNTVVSKTGIVKFFDGQSMAAASFDGYDIVEFLITWVPD